MKFQEIFMQLTSSIDSIKPLNRYVKRGHVYRRADLAKQSNAVDRHLGELVAAGLLTKLSQGLYYAPKRSRFGVLPPDDSRVVEAFLQDDSYLMFSPSSYNSAGLGTTQLYNTTTVYNHKRHGVFNLGNREFDFRVKPRFPKALTPEFLYVDLLNNLKNLAEDTNAVLSLAQKRVTEFESTKLLKTAMAYGSVATRKRVQGWLDA